MKLNLYHLDVDFIKNHSCLKDSWRHEARQYPEEIRAFIKDNQEKLIENDVEINIFPYFHIPGVHGFRIGNGNLYISFSLWSNGQIKGADSCTFERIVGSDTSKRAEYMRELYANWIESAEQVAGHNSGSSATSM